MRLNKYFMAFVVATTGLSACGGSGDGNTTDVILDINTAPVANALTVEAREDGSIAAKLSASDEDGDALTFIIVTQPANGSVVIDGIRLLTHQWLISTEQIVLALK